MLNQFAWHGLICGLLRGHICLLGCASSFDIQQGLVFFEHSFFYVASFSVFESHSLLVMGLHCAIQFIYNMKSFKNSTGLLIEVIAQIRHTLSLSRVSTEAIERRSTCIFGICFQFRSRLFRVNLEYMQIDVLVRKAGVLNVVFGCRFIMDHFSSFEFS